jgi:deoxyribonuclease V
MFQPTLIPSRMISDGAILIVDVDYRDNFAVAAGILIQDWSSTECAVITVKISEVEPYIPGEFYKRELPCILEVLKFVNVSLGCIVVDGYVYLGEKTHDGLGAHLHKATNIPVIGVGKTYFAGTLDDTKVFRNNAKPIYVTSIGGDAEAAKWCIETMAGDFRIPGMLKFADHVCRDAFKDVQEGSSPV